MNAKRYTIYTHSLDCHENLLEPDARTPYTSKAKTKMRKIASFYKLFCEIFLHEHEANISVTNDFYPFYSRFHQILRRNIHFSLRIGNCKKMFSALVSLLCNFFSSFSRRTSFYALKKETTFLNWFSTTLFSFEKIAYIK